MNKVSTALRVARSILDKALPDIPKRVLEQLEALINDYYNGTSEKKEVSDKFLSLVGTSSPFETFAQIMEYSQREPVEVETVDNTPESNKDKRASARHWTKSEDFRLLAGVFKYGTEDWVSISKFVGNGRDRAQCAQRWHRGLDPRLCKDQWTPDEDEKLIMVVTFHYNKGWTYISRQMGNRSDVQCRYHLTHLVREGIVRHPNLIRCLQMNPKLSEKHGISYPPLQLCATTFLPIMQVNQNMSAHLNSSCSLYEQKMNHNGQQRAQTVRLNSNTSKQSAGVTPQSSSHDVYADVADRRLQEASFTQSKSKIDFEWDAIAEVNTADLFF